MAERNNIKKAALLMLVLGVDASVHVARKLEQSVAYDILRESARIKALDRSADGGARGFPRDLPTTAPWPRAAGCAG